MTGKITRGVDDKFGVSFFPVPDLLDAQHGHSAIIAADLLLCQRRNRFRVR